MKKIICIIIVLVTTLSCATKTSDIRKCTCKPKVKSDNVYGGFHFYECQKNK